MTERFDETLSDSPEARLGATDGFQVGGGAAPGEASGAEVQASPTPIILFVDEAHTLIGAGGAAGTGDAANLLKPALARGTLRTIAATTWGEYKKHIEKDPALTRRFQVIQVDEPDEGKAIRMARGIASTLEGHHRVQVLDEALEAAVRLSHRYIPARQLPDKAVSLLDTSCARVAISQSAVLAAVEDSRRRIEGLETELAIIDRETVVGVDTTARRQSAQDQLEAEQAHLVELEERWKQEQGLVDRILDLRAQLRGQSDKVEGTETELESAAAAVTGTEVVDGGPLPIQTSQERVRPRSSSPAWTARRWPRWSPTGPASRWDAWSKTRSRRCSISPLP